MFRFSKDEYIASKQQEEVDKLIDEICASASIQYSKDIDEMFKGVTYGYLEEFTKLVRNEFNEKITIVAIPRGSLLHMAQRDLKMGFEALDKSWKDPLPYIEHSFAEDYVCPHGPQFIHCFFFFFTQYHTFEGSEECVKYYLERINKLKAFL